MTAFELIGKFTIEGLDKASKNLTAFEKQVKGFTDFASKAGKQLTTFVTLPILGIGAAGLKSASDMEAVENKFNTAFKGMESGAKEAFETLRQEYDLSEKQSKSLLSNTGDLLKGFGATSEQALATSLEVQKLAIALGAYNGRSVEEASAAVTKALLGETESLKSLGVVIRQEDVNNRLLLNGQQDLTGQSLLLAKAQIALTLSAEQSQDAIKSYAENTETTQRTLQRLRASISDIVLTIGEKLIPAFNEILNKYIIPLIDKFKNLSDEQVELGIKIALVVAAIGPLLTILGKVPTAISGIQTAISGLKTAFNLMTGPAGWVTLAVGAIVGLTIAIDRNIRKTKELQFAQKTTNELYESFMLALLSEGFDQFGDLSTEVFEKLRKEYGLTRQLALEAAAEQGALYADTIQNLKLTDQEILGLKDTLLSWTGDVRYTGLLELLNEVQERTDAAAKAEEDRQKANLFNISLLSDAQKELNNVLDPNAFNEALRPGIELFNDFGEYTLPLVDLGLKNLFDGTREVKHESSGLYDVLKPVIELYDDFGNYIAPLVDFGLKNFFDGTRIVTEETNSFYEAMNPAVSLLDDFGNVIVPNVNVGLGAITLALIDTNRQFKETDENVNRVSKFLENFKKVGVESIQKVQDAVVELKNIIISRVKQIADTTISIIDSATNSIASLFQLSIDKQVNALEKEKQAFIDLFKLRESQEKKLYDDKLRAIDDELQATLTAQGLQEDTKIQSLEKQLAKEIATNEKGKNDAQISELQKSIARQKIVDDYAKKIDEINQQSIDAENKRNEDKAKKDAELAKQASELKKKQFEQDKAIAVALAVINTAAAIIGFLANPGGIPGIVLSVAAGVTGAIQAAVIASEPVPKFAQGGKVQGQGISDTVPALLTPGERILPVRMNEMFEQLLQQRASIPAQKEESNSMINNVINLDSEPFFKLVTRGNKNGQIRFA